jgi:acetoin utilization protein AcuB
MNLRDFDHMPPIGAVMTPFPHFIEANEPISEAEARMASHRIRHLPVQHEGEVVGIITERDLRRLVQPSLPPVNTAKVRARDVMRREVFVADIHTPLDEVLSEMAERRVGAAVILRNGKLAGIFSTVDACQVLARVLEERFPRGPGDAA